MSSPSHKRKRRLTAHPTSGPTRGRKTAVLKTAPLFTKIFLDSPQLISITELESGRCIEVNDACLKTLGLTRNEVIGQTLLMLRVWPDPDERAAVIERLRSEGAVKNHDVSIRVKSGALRKFLIATDVITFEDRQCFLMIGHDITERKQHQTAQQGAHQELDSKVRERTAPPAATGAVPEHQVPKRRHAQQLREGDGLIPNTVLDSLPAHVCLVSETGVILQTNNAWRQFAQKNAEPGAHVGEVGDNYLDVCRRAIASGETSVQVILDGIESVLAGERAIFSTEYPCDLPEGWHWFLLRVTAVKQGGGAVITHLDINERKSVEDKLRRSEIRYSTLVKASSAVEWSCPSSGLQETPQPSWMAFTGQTAEEMLGAGWADAVHPDDLASATQRWNEAVSRGELYLNEHRIRRYDGQWRWMSVVAVPLRNECGQIVEWTGMNFDITPRKEAELEMVGDLNAMSCLQKLGLLSVQQDTLEPVLAAVLDAA